MTKIDFSKYILDEAEGVFTLKNMASGEQSKLRLEELVTVLK